jgi:hypothetical protein
MRPENNHRNAIVSGSQDSTSFEISLKDSAHIMGILREGLYTDRILAVLREYGANAWDAHRAAGKHATPIEIHIPNENDPVLRIRDYGTGLSHDDMFAVFTQYGSSTKRGSDDVVGMLGIGSKSGFAYADTFTVISRHGGHQRTYVAALDESEKGTLSLLDDRECEADDTGIEIQITSKSEDVYTWQNRARRIYKHFEPRPTINVELPEPPSEITRLEHGTIVNGDGGNWIAVMGCVPYRVNLEQLEETRLPKCLRELSGQLHFTIGEVQPSASREELKYTKATKEALVEKFTSLVDEYVTQALKALEADVLTEWEKRLSVRVLHKLNLPLPEQWKDYATAYVQVVYDDKSGFTILHNAAVTTRVTLDADTKLWIDDAGRDLKGYNFSVDDYVVRGRGRTPAEVRTLLDAALAASKLTGVTICLLSTRDWAEWRVPKKKTSNPKHRARMFKLVDAGKVDRASDRWEVVVREPEDTDVWVELEAFLPTIGSGSWFSSYKHAIALAEKIGVPVPEVYGYKTTAAKPLDTTKLAGQSWEDWNKAFTTTLQSQYGHLLEWHHWTTPEWSYNMETYRFFANLTGKDASTLESALGTSHPIAALARKTYDIRQDAKKISEALAYLRERGLGPTWKKSEAKQEIDAAMDLYPLLSLGISHLADKTGSGPSWIEYIKLIDAKEQLLSVTPIASASGQATQLKVV